MCFLRFDLPSDGATGAGGRSGADSGVDKALSRVRSVVITALLGNLEVLEVLWMDIDGEGSLGTGDRSDLVETGSGSGADSLVDSCLSGDSETSEEVWVEVGGISGVGSGLTGDLGSLEEVIVEVGVLLGLLRLGRTLKRFLLLDKALVDALWPATSL